MPMLATKLHPPRPRRRLVARARLTDRLGGDGGEAPLALSRLRARGELVEVRAADLRFTTGEAAEFLNGVMELQLDPTLVAALEARTEGWAAGLQLAALSARTRSGAADGPGDVAG